MSENHEPQSFYASLGAFALMRDSETGKWAALSLPRCPVCGQAEAYVFASRQEALDYAIAQMGASQN